MAKEARKLKRAGKAGDGKSKKKDASRSVAVGKPQAPPDPLSKENLKKLAPRLGLPVIAVWILGGSIAGFSTSSTVITVALVIPGVLTVAVAGLLVWVVRQAKKAQGVAGILSGVETDEDRVAALEKLESGFKKGDPAAIFARAQLEMQQDPRQALTTLEGIDLKKVMAPVADEARGQRAMIHLMLGQPQRARALVDDIELKRHQEAKTRAMLGAVVAESWARTGQAKKAIDTLELFDLGDEEFADLLPQLDRAWVFAYAYTNKLKPMRHSLRRLLNRDWRLLGGFVEKKTHPMLMKEAKKMLEQSGKVPRKMQVQRRM